MNNEEMEKNKELINIEFDKMLVTLEELELPKEAITGVLFGKLSKMQIDLVGLDKSIDFYQNIITNLLLLRKLEEDIVVQDVEVKFFRDKEFAGVIVIDMDGDMNSEIITILRKYAEYQGLTMEIPELTEE